MAADTKPELESIKSRLKATPSTPPNRKNWLSTGSTLLNLALTGHVHVGLAPGHYYLLVGDSQAGKTWLMRQIMAEATKNDIYNKYRLIHDDAERGALMDVQNYFGPELAKRLEHPPYGPGHSVLLEDFYDNVDDAVKAGKPFIYGLDSEDALQSESEVKKDEQNKKARRKVKGARGSKEDDGAAIKGSFGVGKAKKNSTGLRAAHNGLEATNSILLVIKQTRDNIDMFAKEKKTRSGGQALTFYATSEMWFSVDKQIKKKFKGKPLVVGTKLKVRVKKNRTSGLDRSVILNFYPEVGFDDVGSCIDWLVEWKCWEAKGDEDDKIISATEFQYEGGRDKLVEKIEEEGKELHLISLVSDWWNEIQDGVKIVRKSRYNPNKNPTVKE